MKANLHYAALFGLLFLLACSSDKRNQTLFTRLPSDETGIEFNNINVENEQINIFSYEYLYNGAGVATGDINNDGLVDIYFSSNNLENKLYLNKGNLHFEDITDKAGVGCKQGWKTGVSMVDINGDGFLDLYVCRSADSNPANRKNALLINNGNLTFTEKAAEYGLDNNSYSTQTAFFDYDRDGDLDAFLLNHSLLQLSNSFDIRLTPNMRFPYIGNQLLRNDNNKFIDISDEAGVFGPTSNYGLGIGISDINNDSWPDVYVSNDYVDKDKMYVNTQNGKFRESTDSLFTHISQFSMGMDIADINRDGFTDLITLDMLPEDNKRQKLLFGPDRYDVFNTSVKNGYHYQYMRNMLQLNNGDGSFSEIGQIAGVSNTDWSWSALFADFDNDGWQDLFISNGYKRDFTNNDFLKYRADMELKAMGGKRGKFSEMIKRMPANKIHNYIFKNNGDLTFKDVCADWGLTEKTLTNGAAYADLDNDGDLDLIMNHMDENAGIYRNNSQETAPSNYLKVRLVGDEKNKSGIGARITVFTNGELQLREQFPVRGFQSSMDHSVFFGLGTTSKIDSLIIQWPLGQMQTLKDVSSNKEIILNISDATTRISSQRKTKTLLVETGSVPFTHKENEVIDFKTQWLLPRMYSTQGPAIASGDVNSDGRMDMFLGGAKEQTSEILVQQRDGSFKPSNQAVFKKINEGEDVDAVFFDMDGDKDDDLYVVKGGYEFLPDDNALQDELFRNSGNGKFEKAKDALPAMLSSGSCVRPSDVDGDGDLDLFVGGRIVPGRYPEIPESYILINDGKGKFSIQTETVGADIKSIGLVTDATWMDLNNDRKNDLVIVGEWMDVKFFLNENGKLVDRSSSYLTADSRGWWNSIAKADIDNDGDLDLLLGNFGMNNQMKPTKQRPVTMVYSDYDKNGSIDPLLCYYIGDKSYPYANRDELTDQVPMFKKRFTDYESYSDVTLDKILNPTELASSKTLTATRFETSLLKNNGNGTFSFGLLPLQCQFAPVFAIAALDVNGDKNLDLIMAGNLEKTRVRTGKFSANTGQVLLGDGKGNFSYVPQQTAGLSIKGDVRRIVADTNRIVFGVNNSTVKTYVINNADPTWWSCQRVKSEFSAQNKAELSFDSKMTF
jgi:enediyne biosynthesis protein E4